MTLLDTHVLVWWSKDLPELAAGHKAAIDRAERDGLAVSAISMWEVAVLVGKGRLDLAEPIQSWFDRVLAIPTLTVLPASPQILLDSTRLPGEFHPDPADRIIVATARAHSIDLLTIDRKILAYPHVRAIGPS